MVSPHSLSSMADYNFIDKETSKCQENCLSGPELLECDRECVSRYPEPDSQDLCVRFCTRDIYICLKGCANLDKLSPYEKLAELLGRTKEQSA